MIKMNTTIEIFAYPYGKLLVLQSKKRGKTDDTKMEMADCLFLFSSFLKWSWIFRGAFLKQVSEVQ